MGNIKRYCSSFTHIYITDLFTGLSIVKNTEVLLIFSAHLYHGLIPWINNGKNNANKYKTTDYTGK